MPFPESYNVATNDNVVAEDHNSHTRDILEIAAQIATVTRGPKRQTVLTGSVDSEGTSNFLAANGASVNLNATTIPVNVSFAAGFGTYGAIDYIGRIAVDTPSAWAALPANVRSFLFVERNPLTGALTYGTRLFAPAYSYKVPGVDGTFDGRYTMDNVSGTTLYDERGVFNATMYGSPTFSAGKIGNAINLDGSTTQYVTTPFNQRDNFTVTMWLKPTNFAARRYIYGQKWMNGSYATYNAYSINTAGQLCFQDGNSYNGVIERVSTTALAAGVWSHVTITRQNGYVSFYINGVAAGGGDDNRNEYSSSVPFRVGGCAEFNSFLGQIDDFRLFASVLTQAQITAEVADLTPVYPDWFDLSTFTMKVHNGSAWEAKQRVYMGEAVMGASAISSMAAYALQGRYDSGWFPVAASSNYAKNHNLGFPVDTCNVSLFARNSDVSGPWSTWYNAAYKGAQIYNASFRNSVSLACHSLDFVVSANTIGTVTDARIVIERTW